jgi:hypothetical protein
MTTTVIRLTPIRNVVSPAGAFYLKVSDGSLGVNGGEAGEFRPLARHNAGTLELGCTYGKFPAQDQRLVIEVVRVFQITYQLWRKHRSNCSMSWISHLTAVPLTG